MTPVPPTLPTLRRVAACMGLVALLALGVLRFNAHAQEEDVPGPKNASEKIAVFIDKDRNAVIQMDRPASPSGDGPEVVKAGTDLASGLSVLSVEKDLPTNPEQATRMKATKVTAFGQLDTNGALVLGSLNMPIPPEAGEASVSGDLKIQQSDKNVHADLTFNGKAPAKDGPKLTKLAVDVATKTDYKSFTGTVNLALSMMPLQQAPLKAFDLTLAEPDANSTSLDVSLTLDLDNPMMAQARTQLEMIKANPKQIEDLMKPAIDKYVKLDSLSLKADVNGSEGKVSIAMKATGLRTKLADMGSGFAAMSAMGSDPAKIKQAIDDILALVLTKVNLSGKLEAGNLTASLSLDLKNFDRFLTGYTTLMQTVQAAAMKEQQNAGGDESGKLALKWLDVVQKHLQEMGRVSATEMSTAGVTVTQTFKINVEAKDGGFTFDGSGSQDASGFEKAYSALKSKGLPLLERAGAIAHVKTEGGTLSATFLVSAKGDVPQTLKSLFVDPAKADPELKSRADILSNLAWKDGRMQLSVNDGKVSFQSFAKTSDLTPIVAAVLTEKVPALTGTLKGARLESTTKDGNETSSVRLGFSSFFSGKSAAEVKETMSTILGSEDVTVNESADATQVTLATLDEPKIEMAADLASLKSEGESQLASVAAAPGATGGAGGGLNTNVLIGIGVAILALLGIVMASGKKKA